MLTQTKHTIQKTGWQVGMVAIVMLIGLAALNVSSVFAVGTVTYNPLVATMINNVSQAELEPAVKDLTGVTSPLIGGSPYTILTRGSSSGEPIDKAEQYIYEKLQTYGLSSVSYQNYPGKGAVHPGRNIIGQITGTTKPNEIVIIGCHIDNQPWGEPIAPGADDDASGCSANLYLARSFAGKSFARTIRFVFFGSEENAPWTSNKYGSGYYAAQASAAGENIVVMIEADALAYNGGSPPAKGRVVEMHIRMCNKAPAAEKAIMAMWHDVIATYNIAGLNATDYAMSMKYSDHGAFWSYYSTVPAVLLIEQEWDVTNPNWHTTGDTISTFNWTYYLQVTRTLVGLAAHQAQIISTQ